MLSLTSRHIIQVQKYASCVLCKCLGSHDFWTGHFNSPLTPSCQTVRIRHIYEVPTLSNRHMPSTSADRQNGSGPLHEHNDGLYIAQKRTVWHCPNLPARRSGRLLWNDRIRLHFDQMLTWTEPVFNRPTTAWILFRQARKCFKKFVRDSWRSENTPDTYSPGMKFVTCLINWSVFIHILNLILQ